MNSISPLRKISTYEDLQEERARLEELIKIQKIIIRQDVEELKLVAEEKLKPVTEAAHFIKKLTAPETRNNTLLGVGTSITLDLLIRRLFAKSNILLQIFLPTLVKNYSTHLVADLLRKIAAKRKNGHANPPAKEDIHVIKIIDN